MHVTACKNERWMLPRLRIPRSKTYLSLSPSRSSFPSFPASLSDRLGGRLQAIIRLVPETVGIVQTAHFSEEQGLHSL